MRSLYQLMIAILLIILFAAGSMQAKEIRGQTATGSLEWSPQSFAGFYYDIDKDLGTERIITTVTDEKLEEPQGIVYTTTAQKNDFDFEIWGYYNVIGFMGQKYFAGYAQDDSYDYPSILYQESIDENSLADEQLQKILMDSDSETIVTKDAPLTLAEGYVLRLKYVDEKGMLLEMVKNGAVVDSKALSPSIDGATVADKTYYYRKDVGDQSGLVIIAVHFKNSMLIENQSIATADGIWQISDTPTSVKAYSQFGRMRIASVSADTITMDNQDSSIFLGRNMDIPLMGDFKIRTADQDIVDDGNPLRYYIYREDDCRC